MRGGGVLILANSFTRTRGDDRPYMTARLRSSLRSHTSPARERKHRSLIRWHHAHMQRMAMDSDSCSNRDLQASVITLGDKARCNSTTIVFKRWPSKHEYYRSCVSKSTAHIQLQPIVQLQLTSLNQPYQAYKITWE